MEKGKVEATNICQKTETALRLNVLGICYQLQIPEHHLLRRSFYLPVLCSAFFWNLEFVFWYLLTVTLPLLSSKKE